MLLSLMRKHAQSWLIKALMFIIAVVFVLYFGTMRKDPKDIRAATVDDVLITKNQYKKTYIMLMESFQAQYRDMWNEELAKMLDIENRALDSLINQVLISREAEELGLFITEDEIRQAILNIEAFKTDGRFDNRKYMALLNAQKMTPKEFEESFRKDLLDNKLRQFLSTFAVITDQEMLDRYTFDNEEIKVSTSSGTLEPTRDRSHSSP